MAPATHVVMYILIGIPQGILTIVTIICTVYKN